MMRLPQPRHFRPMSAPKRTTTQSRLPQGCGLRSLSTSSIFKSGSMYGTPPGQSPDYTTPLWYNPQTVFGLTIPSLIARVLTLVVGLSVHEFGHAFAADQLGDDTPRFAGRLTLNPLAHLDLMGSLMLIVAGFGWARPVPINPYALQRRTPAGTMIVSAAGPFSNLLLAIAAAIPFRLGLLTPTIDPGGSILPSMSYLLTEFIFLNLILLFFNLVPIFPLDGEKVLDYFLPPSGQDTLRLIRPYGPILLMALLFVTPVIGLNIFGWLVGWPAEQVFRLLVL